MKILVQRNFQDIFLNPFRLILQNFYKLKTEKESLKNTSIKRKRGRESLRVVVILHALAL